MSKRALESNDVEATLPRKKSKKDKKDKKEKKDKQKIRDNEDSVVESAVQAGMDVDSTPELEVKKHKEKKNKRTNDDVQVNGDDADPEPKPKKDKSDKKSKKEKKKKNKTAEVETVSSTETEDPAREEVTNGIAEPSSLPSITSAPNSGISSGKYEQVAALTAISESQVTSFLDTHQITITDPLSYKNVRPITDFNYLPATSLISKNPFASFSAPTPIQAASWPFGLSGRDIVGVAETGSGKTIAFGLPLVEAVLSMPKPAKGSGRIRAVVVSPTRELAMQTNEQLSKLGELVGLKTVCVYGGASKDDQRVLLKKADIIVATPGRLKDFLEEGSIKLDGARFTVLDEADRMLDKGFEDDIKRILGACPSRENRQTLMFTATWPQSVQALASTFMISPVKITIGNNESGDLKANARIAQTVEVVDPRGKEQRLLQILKAQPRNERVLVFCLYKKEATRVEGFLQQRGMRVVGIHGDLRQEQRTRSLEAFKKGETPILVATDVAARGLDIPEVKLVVNVTFPLTIEDYVHRIGRTGRAGKTGQAITLFTEHDKAHSGECVFPR
ncbi:P-loop containing nucleoside triphosphate hydrolase protein [Xylariales sp. PMI_506]|nr:P-loop containing nucleoside triphosphate hydrolase protein [Xylariales sp. PMI_506]